MRIHSGDSTLLCWLPAYPGLPGALPQILHAAGIFHLLTPEVRTHRQSRFPVRSCWWEGIDGTRILLHFLSDPPGIAGILACT